MQPHLQILYSLLMFLVLVPISTHIHRLVSCLFMTQPAHCLTTLSLGNAGTSGFPVTPGAASERWERYCRSSFCLNSSPSCLPHSRHPARPSPSPQGASQQAEHHLCCLPGLKSICSLSLPTLTSNVSSRTPRGLPSGLVFSPLFLQPSTQEKRASFWDCKHPICHGSQPSLHFGLKGGGRTIESEDLEESPSTGHFSKLPR